MLSDPSQQAPSHRTDQIIGRTTFLETIYKAIQNEDHTWLLYFYGPGGIGKTRLLEEIVTKNGTWDELAFRCTPILDMYHSDYQSSDGVRHSIVTGLEEKGDFEEYHAKRVELAEKLSAGSSSGELQRLQREVEKAFLKNYRALARKHRLMICLDTMELMQYESDPVQKICRVETVDALVMNWLVEQLPTLPNTVILMAGRPENRERIEEIFARRFHAENNSFKAQELVAFSLEETSEYLKKIAQKLKEQDDPNLAETLDKYENLGANFHRVTKGRPVYLALTIDLFLTPPREGKPFINAILSGQEFPENELVTQLIENLMALSEPYGRIIQYLFHARKGLTVDLLQHFGVARIDDHLKWLENLAIAKVRTVGKGDEQQKTYFFHDEVYNMYDQYFKGEPLEGQNYGPFVEYYRLKPQIDGLFYEIRINPYQGYHFHYARQDHDAIVGHDHSYDMRLRNEVLGFLNRYVDKKSPFFDEPIARRLDRNNIDRDFAVRWVRRHWAMGDSKTAREVALALITSEDPLFNWNEIDDDFYKSDILVALVEAAVQEAKEVQSVIEVLNQDSSLDIKEVPDLLTYAIKILREKGKENLNQAEQWHYHRISGAAHNRLGYFYRTTGRYGLALSHYQQAVAHLDLADVKSELAFTLTNAAYLLGLNSRATEALRLISRAIELHQELKRHYPLALALNTKGIIRALDNHPNWGVQDCRNALETVEEIGDDRGTGLALIGLGYTLRKQANQWKSGGISIAMANASFQEAVGVLNKAGDIFSNKFTEPIRRWEAYSELGSLYCDWAWLARSQKDAQQAEEYYDKAINYQKQAEKIAKENKLESQTLDTLDDLAQAYGDRSTLYIEMEKIEASRRDREQAEAYLDEVETLIDAKFKLTSGGFIPGSGEGETQWVAMGKRHLWRGIWRFRDVEYRQVDQGDVENRLSDAMENLFLSTIYFRQYWPTSFDYDHTMGYLTDYLPQIRKYMPSTPQPLAWAKARVTKLEEEYSIQLPELHNLIDRTILF